MALRNKLQLCSISLAAVLIALDCFLLARRQTCDAKVCESVIIAFAIGHFGPGVFKLDLDLAVKPEHCSS